MFNYDMIGRLTDGKLILGGTGTAAEFDGLLPGMADKYGLTISEDRSGLGGSDHLSFLQFDHPSLFFFTGAHKQRNNFV